MSKSDNSTPPPSKTTQRRGYQPKPTTVTEGYKPHPKDGYQPTTSESTPNGPPPNPPNEGSSGKK